MRMSSRWRRQEAALRGRRGRRPRPPGSLLSAGGEEAARVSPRRASVGELVPGSPRDTQLRICCFQACKRPRETGSIPCWPIRYGNGSGRASYGGVREGAAGDFACLLRCAGQEGRRRTTRWGWGVPCRHVRVNDRGHVLPEHSSGLAVPLGPASGRSGPGPSSWGGGGLCPRDSGGLMSALSSVSPAPTLCSSPRVALRTALSPARPLVPPACRRCCGLAPRSLLPSTRSVARAGLQVVLAALGGGGRRLLTLWTGSCPRAVVVPHLVSFICTPPPARVRRCPPPPRCSVLGGTGRSTAASKQSGHESRHSLRIDRVRRVRCAPARVPLSTRVPLSARCGSDGAPGYPHRLGQLRASGPPRGPAGQGGGGCAGDGAPPLREPGHGPPEWRRPAGPGRQVALGLCTAPEIPASGGRGARPLA